MPQEIREADPERFLRQASLRNFRMNKIVLQNALLEGRMLPNNFSGGQSHLQSAFDAQSLQEAIASVPSNNKPAEENGSALIQGEASHVITILIRRSLHVL